MKKQTAVVLGFLFLLSLPAFAENPRGCAALLAEVRLARAVIKRDAADHVIENNDHWGVDAGVNSFHKYESSFWMVMERAPSKRSFDGIAKSRLSEGKSMNYLDLFGSGNILAPENYTTATAVRLMAWNAERLDNRSADLKKKYEVLSGDLFNDLTWQRLQKNLDARNIKNLDLITINPIGGLMNVDHSVGFYLNYSLLLRRAYRMLSRDGGVMFAQLSISGHRLGFYEGYEERLRAAGIEARVEMHSAGYYPALRIQKNPASAALLPL